MPKYDSDYILPPKQQMRCLIEPQEIRCNEGLDLIFKSSNMENLSDLPL